MEHRPFQDAFPMEHGDIPANMLVYRRVVLFFLNQWKHPMFSKVCPWFATGWWLVLTNNLLTGMILQVMLWSHWITWNHLIVKWMSSFWSQMVIFPPAILVYYTLEDKQQEPTAINHFERNMLFQTSMIMEPMLIFRGVEGNWDDPPSSVELFPVNSSQASPQKNQGASSIAAAPEVPCTFQLLQYDPPVHIVDGRNPAPPEHRFFLNDLLYVFEGTPYEAA